MVSLPAMQDKVVLITGATDGIGRITAERLAAAGAKVVMVGRNREKTEQVARAIGEQFGPQRVDFLLADLSVQAQVHQLASAFRARYQQLDVLINNAGAVFMRRQESADGIELTFALNHLAYFLLTNLLLDRLTVSAPARIVNVSSDAHHGARLNLNDLENRRGYTGFKAYSQSKLANVLFTYELARRLQGCGVTANALHPGFVATNFGLSNGGLIRYILRLFQLAAMKPAEGAQTTLYLATSPAVAGVSGQYFSKEKPVRSAAASYDQDAARRLWEVSAQMTGLKETV
jgi:NAD(P)-dependent dehydrogenase (short-subunit alcohol dehydrogenase family)